MDLFQIFKNYFETRGAQEATTFLLLVMAEYPKNFPHVVKKINESGNADHISCLPDTNNPGMQN